MSKPIPAAPSTPPRVPYAPAQPPDDMRAAHAELRVKLPTIQAEAARRPGGVNASYAWALKRLERWAVGDGRPVIVNRINGGTRFIAEVTDTDRADGLIIDLGSHVKAAP